MADSHQGAAEQWYLSIGGRVYGPADRGVLDGWAHQGRIRADALGCLVGFDEWLPVGRIPQLASLPLLEAPLPSSAPSQHPHQPPPPPLAEPAREPPLPHQICPCPECGGPVDLVVSASSRPGRGFWTAAAVRFTCSLCGVQLPLDRLPSPALGYVRRQMLIDFALSVVVPVVLLALCLVPLAALILSVLP